MNCTEEFIAKMKQKDIVINFVQAWRNDTLEESYARLDKPTRLHTYSVSKSVTSIGVGFAVQEGLLRLDDPVLRFYPEYDPAELAPNLRRMTVRDLLTLAAGKPLSMGEACEYLSEVGLCAKEYVNREVNASLSGGELKRMEIAMILARGTKFSVFDEPEAGIDLWSFQNLIGVFRNMYEQTHGTILIISHQERILDIADRVIVLSGGHVTADGSREDILPGLLHVTAGCAVAQGKETHNG